MSQAQQQLINVQAQWNIQKTTDIALMLQRDDKGVFHFVAKDLTVSCTCAHEYAICEGCDFAETPLSVEEYETVLKIYERDINKPDVEVE